MIVKWHRNVSCHFESYIGMLISLTRVELLQLKDLPKAISPLFIFKICFYLQSKTSESERLRSFFHWILFQIPTFQKCIVSGQSQNVATQPRSLMWVAGRQIPKPCCFPRVHSSEKLKLKEPGNSSMECEHPKHWPTRRSHILILSLLE